MRPNVKQFVEMLSQAADLPQPIVDIGALRTEGQEGYADLRPYFPSRYSGWDMRRGPGVDVMASIHHLPIRSGTIGTALVLDTLEHVLDPIASMQEVCRAIRPEGVVLMSSHMNFPIHAHPSDYWRFTPVAFDYLLRPLGTRVVYTQGDSENPHTVLAAGMRSCGSAAGDAFAAALHTVEARWPDDSYGGPLLAVEPATIDVSQRVADRDLPALEDGRSASQTFICGANGLCRIDVKMANRAGPTFGHLLFRVTEVASGQELTAHRVFAWHIDDDAWLAIPVPVQSGSAGHEYAITIESPDASAGQAVSAKASVVTTYPAGQLVIDGAPAEGSLCFQTYCRAPGGGAPDIQVEEDILSRGVADSQATGQADYGMRLTALAEQHWAQVRYLASTIEAGFDGMREQMRADHAELMDLQRQTLHASTEKLIARTVRENAAARALRRLRRKGEPRA